MDVLPNVYMQKDMFLYKTCTSLLFYILRYSNSKFVILGYLRVQEVSKDSYAEVSTIKETAVIMLTMMICVTY